MGTWISDLDTQIQIKGSEMQVKGRGTLTRYSRRSTFQPENGMGENNLNLWALILRRMPIFYFFRDHFDGFNRSSKIQFGSKIGLKKSLVEKLIFDSLIDF